MKLDQRHIQHLLLRCGFGDSYSVIRKYVNQPADKIFTSLLEESKQPGVVSLEAARESSKDEGGSKESMQSSGKQGRKNVRTLNTLWIKEMSTSPANINEKMAYFWHDHFACRSNYSHFMQQYLDVIRTHALGNFGTLLRSVSKSAAMLQYLNNRQNKKAAPNENFAREVMELFTLGRDQHYSEKDISEAARAFTGWNFYENGKFTMKEKTHDNGQKVILGQSGNFDGDEVIDILLSMKQTSLYISKKWVGYFMNYKGNAALENRIADKLYESNYDIKTGLNVLFTSPEFYEASNIGSRIKSPVELIVGMQRQLGIAIKDEESLLYLQRMLGQTLFDPPNVSGWPDGKEWVDSSSLLFRITLPELIFKAATIKNMPDASFDDNDKFKLSGKLKRIETNLNLKALEQAFQSDDLGRFLCQVPVNDDQKPFNLLDQIVFYTSRPEFQLC